MKPYRIFLLGGLKFQNEPHTITRFRTRKTATLLAYLALHRGPQPREVLADLLWPDDAPAAARHSLRMALSSLRSQLEIVEQAPLFEATRFAIGLRVDAVSTDVSDLDAALKNARLASNGKERAEHYAAAIELASGAFLPGFYDDWCLEEAARLEVALANARNYLKQRRAESNPKTDGNAPPTQTTPQLANDSRLATLLVFDGARLTPAQNHRMESNGGNAFQMSENLPQTWHFASASAALQGATWLHGGARRVALCSGEISAHDHNNLWTRARGLLESAAPGQTVCCEATALFERERAEIECDNLGVFELPGARIGAPPERIFQVSWTSEVARSFAPPNARPARDFPAFAAVAHAESDSRD